MLPEVRNFFEEKKFSSLSTFILITFKVYTVILDDLKYLSDLLAEHR